METALSTQDLASEMSLTIVRLARRLRLRRDNSLVSLTQLSALNTLFHEGSMTPGALASAERVKPPSMTRVLASLLDLGMIKREPHPSDGRQAIVTLAPPGYDVVTGEAAAREEWLNAHLGRLDEEERQLLMQALPVLDKIVQADESTD